MKAKIVSILALVVGVVLIAYGIAGVLNFGFYLSGRGDIRQFEGGLSPLFLLIGIVAFIYGIIETKVNR